MSLLLAVRTSGGIAAGLMDIGNAFQQPAKVTRPRPRRLLALGASEQITGYYRIESCRICHCQ